MRETSFIQQNKEKWKEFEDVLEGSSHDPDQLNDLFVQVTDDLSHARTFYPNRSVRVYLNGLAQRIFFSIYKNKRSKRSRFVSFWAEELPLTLYEARRELLVSFLIFVLAAGIGMLSCAADPEFLRAILGDAYVDMTKENIRSGDPMAVYKEKGEFSMFLGITLNNLYVAFLTFVMGIFYGIGTVGNLLFNGVMFGAFQYFFIEQGLGRESFLAVWMHGAFELSAIVIAGAAGLTVGKGLVFPGTLSRSKSFQLAARRGINFMLVIVPFFIVAGFTESYLTRQTELPDLVRGTYIFACLGIMVFFFVILPQLKAKQLALGAYQERTLYSGNRLPPDREHKIDFSSIKLTGDIFTDAFVFLRQNLSAVLRASALGSALFCAGAFASSEVPMGQLFVFPERLFGTLSSLCQFFFNEGNAWVFPIAVLSISIPVWRVQSLLAKEAPIDFGDNARLHPAVEMLKTLFPLALLGALMFAENGVLIFLLMMCLCTLILLWSQAMLTEGRSLHGGLGKALSLSGKTFGQMLGLSIAMLLMGILFLLLPDTPILSHLLQVISTNFEMSETAGQALLTVMYTFTVMFLTLLVLSLWAIAGGLQYFSNLEVHGAYFLKERIGQIQLKRRIRGLEREG